MSCESSLRAAEACRAFRFVFSDRGFFGRGTMLIALLEILEFTILWSCFDDFGFGRCLAVRADPRVEPRARVSREYLAECYC